MSRVKKPFARRPRKMRASKGFGEALGKITFASVHVSCGARVF